MHPGNRAIIVWVAGERRTRENTMNDTPTNAALATNVRDLTEALGQA